MQSDLEIPITGAALKGTAVLPAGAEGMVVFAHGSGSSRLSPRNLLVAQVLQRVGLGTLLFDLLTEREDSVDCYTREFRFDIELLSNRLTEVTRWATAQPQFRGLRIGYFGASTGSAAALIAAATLGEAISAVVSRGGRPDLAGDALPEVVAPTLLIVGQYDIDVIELNRQAHARMKCEKQLHIVRGASHLFEETGTLEKAAAAASEWFTRHLRLSGGRQPARESDSSHAVR
jgi:putative phosphoribosyl transferase